MVTALVRALSGAPASNCAGSAACDAPNARRQQPAAPGTWHGTVAPNSKQANATSGASGRGRSGAGERRPKRRSSRHARSVPAVHVPEGHWHQRASAETRRGTLRASADRGEADVPRRRRSRKPQASDGRRGGRCCFERSLRPLTYRSATDVGGRAQQCDTTRTPAGSHHAVRASFVAPKRPT